MISTFIEALAHSFMGPDQGKTRCNFPWAPTKKRQQELMNCIQQDDELLSDYLIEEIFPT